MARWISTNADLYNNRFDLDKAVSYGIRKSYDGFVVEIVFGNETVSATPGNMDESQCLRCLQWLDWQIEQDNTNRVVAIPDFTLPAPVIETE